MSTDPDFAKYVERKFNDIDMRIASVERACGDLAAAVRDLAAHATHINEVTAALLRYGESKRRELGDSIRPPKEPS